MIKEVIEIREKGEDNIMNREDGQYCLIFDVLSEKLQGTLATL